MNIHNAISLYNELIPEIPKRGLPSLQDYLYSLGPLPEESVVFGMCADGLPYLMNVRDTISPHILIEHGKPVLETVAESVRIVGERSIETVVLSNSWKLGGNVAPFYSHADQMILALASWAHGKHGKHGKQRTMLLVDGLENVSDLDFDAQQNFRWLQLHGRARGVYIVASYTNYSKLNGLDGFSCHIKKDGNHFVAPEGQGFVKVYAL